MATLASILLAVGSLLAFAGSVMIVIAAFNENVGWGLACLFIPCAGLVFVFTHWEEAKAGFFTWLGGMVFYIPAVIISVVVGFNEAVAEREAMEEDGDDDKYGYVASADSGGSQQAGNAYNGGAQAPVPGDIPGDGTGDPAAQPQGVSPDGQTPGGGYGAGGYAPGGYGPGAPGGAGSYPPGVGAGAGPGGYGPGAYGPGSSPAGVGVGGGPPGTGPQGVGTPGSYPPGTQPPGFGPGGRPGGGFPPGVAPPPGVSNEPGEDTIPPGGVPPAGAPGDTHGDGVPDFPGQTNQTPKKPVPEKLSEKADYAFEAGRVADGFQYLYATALIDDDKALWKQLQWSSELRRPVFAIRYGIAVQSSAAASYDPSQGPSGGAGDLPGAPGAGAPPGVGPPGGIGPPPGVGPPGAAPGAVPGAQPGGIGPSSSDDPKMRTLDYFTAGIGPKLARSLETRGRKSGVSKHRVNLGTVLAAQDTLEAITSEAAAQGIDVVAVFQLTVKSGGLNKRESVTLMIVLADARTGRVLMKSKPLNSLQYLAAKQKGIDQSNELIQAISSYIDKNLALEAKPNFTADEAHKRAAAAAEDAADNPLPALAEVRYYQMHGLLTNEQLKEHYQTILGAAESQAFLGGKQEERLKALSAWLPDLSSG